MNPVVRTMGAYMLGVSMRLFSMVAFIKEGQSRPTGMHTDSVGVPTPLPFYGTVCNVSWLSGASASMNSSPSRLSSLSLI